MEDIYSAGPAVTGPDDGPEQKDEKEEKEDEDESMGKQSDDESMGKDRFRRRIRVAIRIHRRVQRADRRPPVAVRGRNQGVAPAHPARDQGGVRL